MTRKIFKFFIPIFIFLITLEGLSFLFLKIVYANFDSKWDAKWALTREGDLSKRPELRSFFAAPGSETIQTIISPEKKKTEISYRINEFGQRGSSPDKRRKKSHAFISGCSYVFGYGVPEDETISSYLGELHPDTRVINLGWPSGGMHTALRYFDVVNPGEFAPEENGTFIYVYLHFHVSRWLRHFSYFKYVPEQSPYYEKADGKYVYRGRIKEHSRYKFLKTIKLSSFGRLVAFFLTSSTVPFQAEDVHAYFDVVEELSRRYKKFYPRGRFVVVAHPLQDSLNYVAAGEREAKKRGMEFFDSIEDFKKQEKHPMDQYFVPGDKHPSGKLNEFFAGWMSEKILTSKWPVKR